MDAPNKNTAWARVLIDELTRSGLAHVALAPGSRSTPLVLAAARHDDLTLHTFIDERSAAFFALGIGKATGAPAAVVTTSGTAAVNLHPAVVEAHQAGVPMLALTADRPRRLRTTDANQTIDQVDLYGTAVRAFHDAPDPEITAPALTGLRQLACRVISQARGPPPGPVHLNLPFDKPLEPTPVPGDVPDGFGQQHPVAAHGRPDGQPYTRIDTPPHGPDQPASQALADEIQATARGLIVAGPARDPGTLGPAVLALAQATGYPLLADPLSGARFAPGAPGTTLAAYDHVLRAEDAWDHLAPELVLRIGARPTSKPLTRFLGALQDARQIVLDDGPRHQDHLAAATDHLTADPARLCDTLAGELEPAGPVVDKAWAATWQEAEARARPLLDNAEEVGWSEGPLVGAITRALPPGTHLFVSNSMPVRDLDGYAAPREAPIPVHGNRGASGIDGILSTASGIAATAGPTVAVVGDLAFLHDTNGLLAMSREQLDLVVVVLDNDGGAIFHHLPIADHDPEFTPYFATPHGLDLAHACDLYDVPHERVDAPGDVPDRVTRGIETGGPLVIQVPIDRETNHERHTAIAQRVTDAITRTFPRGGSP